MKKVFGRFSRKSKPTHQEPSFLSNLLIGDVDVCGHIEIQVPRATDRVIHIDISTKSKEEPDFAPTPTAHVVVDDACVNPAHDGLMCQLS